jgi:hypothetical protein
MRTRCLQIELILPVDGFSNNSLSVVSYCHFHKTYLHLEKFLETYSLSVLNVTVGF